MEMMGMMRDLKAHQKRYSFVEITKLKGFGNLVNI